MRDGRVPPARDARDPAPRRVDLLRPVRDPELQRHVHRASSRTRRRRTRTAAPAGPRRRTSSSGRWTRSPPSSGWTRSSSAARTSSRSSRTRWRPGSRSTRATTTRRSTGCSSCSTSTRSRRTRQSRRASGDAKQIGVGFSTYNEMCGLAPSRILGAIRYAVGGWDSATIRFQPLGSVQVVTGTSPHGQSHETTWAQIVADQLGVDVDDVEVLHGDTAVSQQGMDTYGSRSLTVGGIALWHAGEKIVDKARQIVAHQLEVSEDDLEFANGTFSVKGSPDRNDDDPGGRVRRRTRRTTSRTGWSRGSRRRRCSTRRTSRGRRARTPRSSRSTRRPGDTRLVRYVAVDDVGAARQPDDHRRPGARRHHAGHRRGALRGGRLRRGREPADDDDDERTSCRRRPSFRPSRPTAPRRSADNPLGVKGVGETGTIAAAPAVINAVVDALSHLGVTDIQMPATPERVWTRDPGGEVMIPAAFDYEVAESAEHAIALLGEREDAKLLAGGHSLIPAMKLRTRPAGAARRHRRGSASSRYVRDGGRRSIAIGALTRHQDVRDDALLQRALPDRRVHGGADRRSAGAAPRDDRRVARARRSRVRPARR